MPSAAAAHRLAPPAERALVLLAGFVAAKVALVALRAADGGGRTLLSAWSPLALVYQDVLVVAGFFAIDLGLVRPAE